jgi:hypothetical protein
VDINEDGIYKTFILWKNAKIIVAKTSKVVIYCRYGPQFKIMVIIFGFMCSISQIATKKITL